MPPELVNGVYANLLVVWHTPNDFTLDFICTDIPRPNGEGGTVVPANVVSRVKVPVSVIFRIAQAIAQNVDQYEKNVGPITPHPSEGPIFPPEEGGNGEPDPNQNDT